MTGTLGTLVPIILMFAVLYFLLIRPQQKQQKAVSQMQEELKKGDSVVTIGGLLGTVDSIDESKVVIMNGENTSLTFERG
ncbi:preprotein translocase subunit YajC, partial [Bacillus vallismortis]|nr:preprotein translocase subunit YajC [Bacillus vallismortis]